MLRFCLLLCALFGWIIPLRAEFLKTAPEVYQSVGKRAKVVVTRDPQGIFLMYGPEIDLQVFNPAEIKESDVHAHAFLRFDPQLNRYTALLIGKREYRISGSFTLKLGEVRLTVDNINPYCSIVVESGRKDGPKPEILGLLGLSVIVNFSGEQAVALLEANQLNEYRGVVDPYYVRDRQLFVKDRAVGRNALGITLEARNECLSDKARIVSREELQAVSMIRSREEGKRALSALIDNAKRKSALRGLLKLRVTSSSIIAFDPANGAVSVIKKAGLTQQNPLICTIEEVRF